MNLITLRERRKRGDIIQQFKISSRLNKVKWVGKLMIVDDRVGRRSQLCRTQRQRLEYEMLRQPGMAKVKKAKILFTLKLNRIGR